MPLYEYKCNKCNEVFEVLQRFSDAPVKVHEGCGGKVHRLLTTPSFQFKGSGFYITDYGHKHSSAASHESEGTNGNGAAKPAAAPSVAASAATKPAPVASASDK